MRDEQRPTRGIAHLARGRFLYLAVGAGAVLFGSATAFSQANNAQPQRAPESYSAWEVVHSDIAQPGVLMARCGSAKTTARDQLLDVTLDMKDKDVACRILYDYATKTDVPVKVVDRYDAKADAAWRREVRDLCVRATANANGCAEASVTTIRNGTHPRETELSRNEGEDQSSTDVIADWNRADATLIEFLWTPCTPYLVDQKYEQWRAQHLNIVRTGARPNALSVQLNSSDQARDGAAGRSVQPLPSALPDPLPPETNRDDRDAIRRQQVAVAAQEMNNICLRGVTVRSGIRDRWANYVKVQLRERPPAGDWPELVNQSKLEDRVLATDTKKIKKGDRDKEIAALDAPPSQHIGYLLDNLMSTKGTPVGPIFRSGYLTDEAPVSAVTDIEWRNSWLDRNQWLVLVRDHFLQRLRTQSLDPNYPLPDPGWLVHCGPEVRYGGIPTADDYYWHGGNGSDRGCHWSNEAEALAYDPQGGYVQLDISFNPDATLKVSHGPFFGEYWDRAQSRFVARAAERRARYQSAAPLMQNDHETFTVDNDHINSGFPPKLGAKACPHPLPVNGNGKKCNAEAPPRDAVTPRLGDVYTGPEELPKPEAPAGQSKPKG